MYIYPKILHIKSLIKAKYGENDRCINLFILFMVFRSLIQAILKWMILFDKVCLIFSSLAKQKCYWNSFKGNFQKPALHTNACNLACDRLTHIRQILVMRDLPYVLVCFMAIQTSDEVSCDYLIFLKFFSQILFELCVRCIYFHSSVCMCHCHSLFQTSGSIDYCHP